MIESFLCAKLPPHLKQSLNLAYFEISIHDQIIAHLDREFGLSGLETDAKLPIATMATTTTTENKQTQP